MTGERLQEEDCRVCCLPSCDCSCATCVTARERRAAGQRTPEAELLELLELARAEKGDG